ncbi:MAG: ankyrin repeat domain-containing protein, partial [Gammaproteobacteria bacterium]|nr:ankyrin repeat domain-containing protein [Gammaproteobacteria bacterium]
DKFKNDRSLLKLLINSVMGFYDDLDEAIVAEEFDGFELDLIKSIHSENSPVKVKEVQVILDEPVQKLQTNQTSDLKALYAQKIASGEIDPTETSFVDFEANQSLPKEIDYKAIYSQMVSNNKIDPTKTSYDEMVNIAKLYQGKNESEYKTIYSQAIVSGEIDPAETTYDEIVNVAKIFNEMSNSSASASNNIEQIIKELNVFIESLDDEDDKEYNQDLLKDEDYFSVIDDERVSDELKKKVFAYYENEAKSYDDYERIANYYSSILHDIENTKKFYKLAEDKISCFNEVYSLAGNVQSEDYGIEDEEWARQLCLVAYEYAMKSDDEGDLVSLGNHISYEKPYGLGDKNWARDIYKQAIEKVKGPKGLTEVADSVMDEDYLDDKEWAREILKECETQVSNFEEIRYLLISVIVDVRLNDQEWGIQIVERIRGLCESVDNYIQVIKQLETQKELAIELAKEAILQITNDEEKASLARTVELFIEDENFAKEIESSSVDELKNKYSKPSTEELKKFYAAGIGDGSIDPVETNFDSFVKNYDNSSTSSSTEENYNQLLIEAAQNNDLELAQKCLDNNAQIDYQTNDESRTGMWTPLLYAAWHGHFEIGKLLVDNGADLKAEDRKGFRAHDLASSDDNPYGQNGNQELSDYIWNAYVEKHGAWG